MKSSRSAARTARRAGVGEGGRGDGESQPLSRAQFPRGSGCRRSARRVCPTEAGNLQVAVTGSYVQPGAWAAPEPLPEARAPRVKSQGAPRRAEETGLSCIGSFVPVMPARAAAALAEAAARAAIYSKHRTPVESGRLDAGEAAARARAPPIQHAGAASARPGDLCGGSSPRASRCPANLFSSRRRRHSPPSHGFQS